MGFPSDQPPHGSAKPIRRPAPPHEAAPNTAMLKADVDTGATGDKNEVFDPGLATLGTDDEAAGTPVTPARVKLARLQETIRRWRGRPRKVSAAHDKDDRGALYAFVGLTVVIGVAMVGGIVWLT